MSEYKVKSDYTYLRKRAQKTSAGDIYENDYMTISPMDDLFPSDQQIVPSDHNFKFSVRLGYNTQKKHSRNYWVMNGDTEEWTLDNLSGTSVSDETFIRIKPDYSSLRDFAYYGSAVQMIHAAVNDVVLNFPAELYFSEDEFPLDKSYCLVHNGYGINASVSYINENEVDNPLRYLCISNYNYDYYKDGELQSTGVTFTIKKEGEICIPQGGIIASCNVFNGTTQIGATIYTYRKGDDTWLIYKKSDATKGISIRPCQEAIDNFFNELDDFEYVLLDRTSYPLYRVTLETPYETDKGNFYLMKDYIWPSYNNWNPDVDSGAYGKYLVDLIKLAEWHDELDSNNMWRMETHEAIKNLDWTFFRSNGDTTEDLSDIDSSKIEAMIQIYGRAFDGIKRYIDNIKHINNVTYNQKNNLPDYHLTDVAELAGWEVYAINPTAQTTPYCENFYGKRAKGWNAPEANSAFVRNLKINSRYVQSLKGTREGIYTMLALLGVKRNEVAIQETVGIAKGLGGALCGGKYCEFEKLYEYMAVDGELTGSSACKLTTMPLYLNVAGINVHKSVTDYDDNPTPEDYINGLALRVNTYYPSDTTVLRYCTPWFDKDKTYNGNWYFQCNGGWGKFSNGKSIYNPDLTQETLLKEVYDESENYMKYAMTVQDMVSLPVGTLKTGDVCYVMDVDGIGEYMSTSSSLNTEATNDYNAYGEYSHWFILDDKDKSYNVGATNEGWDYVPLSKIRKPNGDTAATKVIYLETIKEKVDGNNPHNGFGSYDDGQEYIERMKQIFKYDIENSGLTVFTDDDQEAIANYKFDINTVTDNKKCWYFGNTETDYTSSGAKAKKCCGTLGIIEGGTKALDKKDNGVSDMGIANSDFSFSGKTTLIKDEYISASTIDPESAIIGDENFSERAADSVINLKNVKITFKYPCAMGDEVVSGKTITDNSALRTAWRKYIEEVALEYVKQMLPATTIWSFEWSTETAECPDGKGGGTKPTPIPAKQYAIPADYTISTITSAVADAVIYGDEDTDGIDTVQYKDNNIIK